MLQLNKREKETIFMMPDDDPCAAISTYDEGLKEILTEFSQDCPHLCQQLYHTAEGRDTFSVPKDCIMVAFAPVGYM